MTRNEIRTLVDVTKTNVINIVTSCDPTEDEYLFILSELIRHLATEMYAITSEKI